VETSVCNLNKDEKKSLVWVWAFQIVNPKTITKYSSAICGGNYESIGESMHYPSSLGSLIL